MKKSYLFLLTALLQFNPLSFAVFDPNISTEEGKTLVRRLACIAFGGKVSSDDKRYFTCSGGKYDGYIVNMEINCATDVFATEYLLDSTTNQPMKGKESNYANMAKLTFETCKKQAKDGKYSHLPGILEDSKKACDKYSDQSAGIYAGVCIMKAANLARYIMGSHSTDKYWEE